LLARLFVSIQTPY